MQALVSARDPMKRFPFLVSGLALAIFLFPQLANAAPAAAKVTHRAEPEYGARPLQPRAEPYALKAGSGKTNVRFSVRLAGKPKSRASVYLQRSGNQKPVAMNDRGKDGDPVAGDGVYGTTMVVDTTGLKPDTCFNYKVFMLSGRTEVSSTPFALCVSAFPLRIEPSDIAHPAEFPDGAQAVANELVFTVRKSTRTAAIRRLAADLDAQVAGSIPALNFFQLKLSSRASASRLQELVGKLRTRPEVVTASINAIGSLASADALYPNQHGLQLVRAQDVWNFGATGWDASAASSVIVTVLDSGLDRLHPDFGTSPGNCQIAEDDCGGANDDSTGHGTQVAGVIAAQTNNVIGIAGIAYGSKIHSIITNSTQTAIVGGSVVYTGMVAGFNAAATYTASHGLANVVNASFNAVNAFADWTPVCAAIEGAVWQGGQAVAVVVNAAGNEGLNGSGIYPARCNDLNAGLVHKSLFITVANSTSGGTCGSVDQRQSTSNYGAWVDIAAPGCDIRTTTNGVQPPDGNYTGVTGTSFSAPMVSGAAALLKSCGVPLDQIESTLKTSGSNVHVAYPPAGASDWMPRLDIYRALHANTPSAAALAAAETYFEDTVLDLADIVVTDANGCAAITATLTLSNTAAGTLSTATSGIVTSTFAGGVWSASGPLADVNALLAGVAFTPAPNFNGSFDIATSMTDGFSPALTGTKVISGMAVNDPPLGLPTITGTVTEDQMLSANTGGIADADGLGAFHYQWLRNGVAIGGANGGTYTLVDADVGQTIRVRVSYVDGGGTAENVTSTPSVAVANVNDAPLGIPTISGGAIEDQVLTANTGGISDADGLGSFSYQWIREGADIPGATGNTYAPGDADVGLSVSVRVSYTDGHGTVENVTSTPTAAVANVNDAPLGLPTISGGATEDQTLAANTGGISDADGLGAFSYQWLRAGASIGGATGSTYTLDDADVGLTISVRVAYTDGHGAVENVTSNPTAAVANVNDAPVGKPVIDPPDASGNRTPPQLLTALTTGISDADGLGAFHYQWWRDATAVGMDSNQYILQSTDLGGHMKVCVSYTDGHITLENGPTLCSDSDATAVGDPHIFTVDGLHYDFQGVGEFVALRVAGAMEIQLRMAAVPTAPPLPDPYSGLTSGVSVNTAVAARVGQHRVTYQPDTGPNAAAGTFILRVDGVPTTLPAGGIDLGDDGRILAQTGGIQIDFPDQTTLMVNTSSWPFYGAWWLHVSVFHTPAYDGIMGARSNGSWLPRLSDGSAFAAKPAALHDRYVELYVKFADSWRVNEDTSLFDYAPDTATATFTNKAWPTENGPYDTGTTGPVAKPLERKAALLACREVAGKNEKADCVFDVRVMGHKGLAKGHLLNQQIRLGAVNVIVRPADKLNARGELVLTARVVRHAAVVPKVPGIRKVPAGTVQFMLGDKALGKPVRLDAKGQARMVVTRKDLGRFKEGRQAITARYLPARIKGNVFLPGVSKRLTRELVPAAVGAGAIVDLPRRMK